MSGLDQLLDLYAPPPMASDLAARAAATAAERPQRKSRLTRFTRRRDPRGGWKRPLLAAGIFTGLAFTSAVAATVASEGRIEIPVVSEMVAAMPILSRDWAEEKPETVAAREPAGETRAPQSAEPRAPAEADAGSGRQRLAERFAIAKQKIEERRAAGLPTPRADRIETQAKRIVERRQAEGKPAPSVEQVEGLLALRELKRMRQWRDIQRNPEAITDAQVARFAERLSPERRERFLALSPDMQRQAIVRTIARIQAQRSERLRQTTSDPESPLP